MNLDVEPDSDVPVYRVSPGVASVSTFTVQTFLKASFAEPKQKRT